MSGRLVIGPAPRRRMSGRVAGRLIILALIIAVVIARLFFWELVVVRGNTMAPAVVDGDILLVRRGVPPAVGDVVVLRLEERVVLRRVVAVAGDRVGSDEGVLTINDLPLSTRVEGAFGYRDAERQRRQERFRETLPDGRTHGVLGDMIGAARPWLFELPPLEVPAGHVFVLCDNRRVCPLDELAGPVPVQWSEGVARDLMWYGDGRLSPPEVQPLYGAFEPLGSAPASSQPGMLQTEAIAPGDQ